MAMIYIKEITRGRLDQLSEAEKRSISDEVDYLAEKRIKELGLPDLNQTSNVPNRLPKTELSCQGVNHV